jgi:hypothetical protein
VAMGVEFEHDRLPNFVDDTAGALVLHRHIKVVAGGASHSDVVLFVRLCQEGI